MADPQPASSIKIDPSKNPEARQGMLDVIGTLKDTNPKDVPAAPVVGEPQDKDTPPVKKLVPPNEPPATPPEPTPTPEPPPEPSPEPPPEPPETPPATPPEEPEFKLNSEDIPSDLLGEPTGEEPPSEPDEDAELLEKMDEKAAHKFREYRTKIKELETQQSATITDSKEYKVLQEQLDVAESKLAAFDLRNSKEFKKAFDAPLNEVYTEIIQMVKEYEGKPEVVDQAIRMNMKDRKRFLMQEIPEAAAELSLLYNRLHTLGQRKAEALKNHAVTRQQMEAAQTEEQNVRQGRAFDTALNTLRSDKNILLSESKDNQDWNSRVQQRIKAARDYLASDDPQQLATMALKAAQCDDYRYLYAQENQKRIAAEKKLGARHKASPTINDGGITDVGTGPKPGSPKEAGEVASIMTGRLGRRR